MSDARRQPFRVVTTLTTEEGRGTYVTIDNGKRTRTRLYSEAEIEPTLKALTALLACGSSKGSRVIDQGGQIGDTTT